MVRFILLTLIQRRLRIRLVRMPTRRWRFFWDEENSKWWYSVLDIVGVLNAQEDYTKNRNYWKYLKGKLKTDNPELVSGTNQFKLRAPDGKMRLTDVLDASGVNDREMLMKGIDCIAKRLAKSRKKISYGILRKDSEKNSTSV